MTDQSKVLFDRDGSVAVVTLNRPQQRNAIDAETCTLLRRVFEEIEQDDCLHVTILAAKGPIFCAGMDLKAFVNGEAADILFGDGHLGGFVSRNRAKPVIAAVQGSALAGGFEIVLACDLVVASRNATFGLPEVKRGLVAGAGGAFRLGQLLPRVVANEMLLTGEPIGADRALGLGLVNRLTNSDPMAEALALARSVARNAPLSISASLILARSAAAAVAEACWSENDRQLKLLVASQDAEEGARAFAEKRHPVWTGK